jgi:hypothetical protein
MYVNQDQRQKAPTVETIGRFSGFSPSIPEFAGDDR